jgi:hypothetical protein
MFNLDKIRPFGESFRPRFNPDDSGKEIQDHLEKILQSPFELSETLYDSPIYKKANGKFGHDCIHNFLEMDLFEYLTYLYEGSSFRMSEFIFIQLLSRIVNPNCNTIRINIDNSFHFLEGALKRQLPKNGFYLRLNNESVTNFMEKISLDYRGVFLTGLGNGQYLGLTVSGPKVMNIEDWAQFYIDSLMKKTEGKYDSWFSFYYKSKRLYQWRLYGKMASGETGHIDYGIDIHIESFKLPPSKWGNIKIEKDPKEKEIVVFKKRVSSNHFSDSLDRFHRNMIQVEGERQEDSISLPFFYGTGGTGKSYDRRGMTTTSGTIRHAFGEYAIDDNRHRFPETPGISTIRQSRINSFHASGNQWNQSSEQQVRGRMFRTMDHTRLQPSVMDIDPETPQFTEENKQEMSHNSISSSWGGPVEHYQAYSRGVRINRETDPYCSIFKDDKDDKQISSSTLSYENHPQERGYCVHDFQNLNLVSFPRSRFQVQPLRKTANSLYGKLGNSSSNNSIVQRPSIPGEINNFSHWNVDSAPYSIILYLSRDFLNNPRPRKRRRRMLAITNDQ